MRIIGFGQEDSKPKENRPDVTVTTDAPVRSLVSINFERMNHALAYYNDQFDLKPGDRVFVTGKLEGEIGIVESVTTKFRIRVADYQKVISVAQTQIHGTYAPKGGMMLSYDANALSADDFRKWILPPTEMGEEPEEIVIGDGYEIPLDDPRASEDADHAVFDRALEYCREGRIGFIAVRNGAGKAFVLGAKWYEIDFRLCDNVLREAYCECPYPGLCKHLLAVGILLRAMLQHDDIDLGRDFTLIAADRFWNMARHSRQTVSLDME